MEMASFWARTLEKLPFRFRTKLFLLLTQIGLSHAVAASGARIASGAFREERSKTIDVHVNVPSSDILAVWGGGTV